MNVPVANSHCFSQMLAWKNHKWMCENLLRTYVVRRWISLVGSYILDSFENSINSCCWLTLFLDDTSFVFFFSFFIMMSLFFFLDFHFVSWNLKYPSTRENSWRGICAMKINDSVRIKWVIEGSTHIKIDKMA